MGKVYESDIDPDEFIRSFREEPSQLSTLKKKPAQEASATSQNNGGSEVHSTTVSDKEAEYIAKFITPPMPVNTTRRDITVDINPDFLNKIRRILSFEGSPRCPMKAYINNVLAEHFKEYEEIIKKRL